MGMEDEFDLMDFSPNLEPTTSYTEVTESDISKAGNNIDSSFSERGLDSSKRGQEVICPHCAKSFWFEGM